MHQHMIEVLILNTCNYSLEAAGVMNILHLGSVEVRKSIVGHATVL